MGRLTLIGKGAVLKTASRGVKAPSRFESEGVRSMKAKKNKMIRAEDVRIPLWEFVNAVNDFRVKKNRKLRLLYEARGDFYHAPLFDTKEAEKVDKSFMKGYTVKAVDFMKLFLEHKNSMRRINDELEMEGIDFPTQCLLGV